MTALTRPSQHLFDTWAECVRDFAGVGLDGSGSWMVDGFGPDWDTFSAVLAVVAEEADTSRRLPEGRVHCDYFWITDPDDTVIGFLAVRHSIDTEFLRTEGGHVGYSIRPARRRQGHASRALGLALVHARNLGLEQVLLTCEESNAASARTIESQGGVLEGRLHDKLRYWITV